jgi:Ca2+-transporting ATPase
MELGGQGLRVLAMAEKEVSDPESDPYEKLTFLGLAGLYDPAREEIPGVLERCRKAGIRVIMVTGDQVETAGYIARNIGLTGKDGPQVVTGDHVKKIEKMSGAEKEKMLNTAVFARVSPEQKLDLIRLHQENGAIVAMTGDGVNDAPALKKADIGVAMGKRGTQVARESADMVLKDDAFSSIVTAVEYGRIIFNNIRKFILYLLSGNVGEILAVSFASVMGLPLPLLPLQILFINLVMDVFPALALGVGPAHEDVMKNRPRNQKESIVSSVHWIMIGIYGLVIAAAVISALLTGMHFLQLNGEDAVTISFLSLAFARLWHVFNMRDSGSPVFRNEITRNPVVWGALVLCLVLVLLTVFVPSLSRILSITPPEAAGWLVVAAMGFIPLIVGQILLGAVRMYNTRYNPDITI